MREFWVASGHHLARVTAGGWLAVTDELLAAWLARPELLPPRDACAAERALHARLRREPRAPVAPAALARLADADARANWAHFLGFRDRLIAAGTIEAAYLAIVRERAPIAPLLLDQLVHLIMRNALEGCADPFVLRAAELFWRPQKGLLREGALVLADLELMEGLEAEAAASPLLALLGQGPQERVEVMSEANAWTYWSRSDAHSMGLPFGAEPRARAGLAAAIAAFLRHLLGLDALIEPLAAVEEPELRWYVGLNREGTAIGDALWRGEDAGKAAAGAELVGLFRMRLAEAEGLLPAFADRPIYLLMGLPPDATLRLKPQNLVVGLPLEGRQAEEGTWRSRT